MAEENKDQVTETQVRQRSDSDASLGDEKPAEEVPSGAHGADPRIADLEAALAARDAEFGKLKEALAEKAALADSQGEELNSMRTAASAAEERIAALSGDLTEAVSRYKERLYTAHPELLESMLTGETIKEVDASLDSALALVDRVKTNIAEKAKEVTVPAGSPERTGPDLSAMSAKEKIAYAIGKESS